MTPFKQNKPHEKRTRAEGGQAGHLRLRGKGEAIAKQKAQRSGGRPCTTRLSKHWTRRGRQPVAVLESAQQRECPVRALPFIGMDLRPDAMPPQSSHHSCHGPNSTPGLPGHVPTPVAKNKGAKTPLPQPMPPPHLRAEGGQLAIRTGASEEARARRTLRHRGAAAASPLRPP
jgi:hypothetical protein